MGDEKEEEQGVERTLAAGAWSLAEAAGASATAARTGRTARRGATRVCLVAALARTDAFCACIFVVEVGLSFLARAWLCNWL